MTIQVRYTSDEPQELVLDNGLRVLRLNGRSPLLELRFVCPGGFAADPRRQSGLAGLAMAMFSEGALHVGSGQLALEREALGAMIYGEVMADGTVVALSALAANLHAAVALYGKVLSEPGFDLQGFERVRSGRLTLIKRQRADPLGLARRLLPPMLFGAGHPYSCPFDGSGTARSIAALEPEDVCRFYTQFLSPERGTLAIFGSSEAGALLETNLGQWRSRGGPSLPMPTTSVVAPSGPAVMLIDKPGATQAAVVAGLLTFPRNSPQAEALMVADAVLGGTFSSRLNLNLREKRGWSYGARSVLLDARVQGLWLVSTVVATDRTGDAMSEILAEIQNLAGRRPSSVEECDRAVDYLVARMPSLYETAAQIADGLARAVIYQLPLAYDVRLAERLRRVTPELVSTVCQRILAQAQPRWVVVGNADQLAGQLIPQFGALEVLGPDAEL